MLQVGEDPENPTHGVLAAPGVNSQVHQHMFCARLDMSVDGEKNIVSEVDVETAPSSPTGNYYGNIFAKKETFLNSEKEAVRLYDANKARTWKISNAEGKVNPITKKPTAYKLIPFTRGGTSLAKEKDNFVCPVL
jgi:primary-amine oxidase